MMKKSGNLFPLPFFLSFVLYFNKPRSNYIINCKTQRNLETIKEIHLNSAKFKLKYITLLFLFPQQTGISALYI